MKASKAGKAGRALPLVILLFAIACSGAKSSDVQLHRTVKATRSWAADVRIVLRCWQQRTVPTHYAIDALEAGEHDLREEADQLEQMQDIPSDKRERASRLAQQLRSAISLAHQAVEQSNGSTVDKVERTIRSLQQQLDKFLREEPWP